MPPRQRWIAATRRPQSPQYVEYWGSLRPCLAPTSGSSATRPVPPIPPAVLPHAYAPVIGDEQHAGPFGHDAFGRGAERAARFFGTPQYILGQTVAVVVWVALNSIALISHWDPYPFILLNLAFSTQAAYAAPLILLAQTRQADRDKHAEDMLEQHRDEVARRAEGHQRVVEKTAEELKALLEANTDLTRRDKELTEQVAKLTREIHARVGSESA